MRDNYRVPRTHTHEARRKRFARDSEVETEPTERTIGKITSHARKKIYLTSIVKNYIQFAKTLKESIGDNFHLKFLGEQIKIQFNKVKDFFH